MRLKDKIAIVTGAGQGIGAAYARRLADEGAVVVVSDINEEKARAVADEIKAKGYEALPVRTDVSDEQSTKALARQVLDKYKRIDILVNNAAIFSTIKLKPAEEISLEEWDQVLDVNLRGTFLCCKAVIPSMKAQKGGKIINISSGTAFNGKPYYIHYVSSKAGIIGFTRALAKEVGEYNIHVNCVTPGYTKTEIPRGTTTPDQLKAIANNTCLKRVGTPEDLAGVVVFLASGDSDFMTGQTVNVDGGDNFH